MDRAPVPNDVLLLVRAEATSAPEQKEDQGLFLLTNNIAPHTVRIVIVPLVPCHITY
jgi:hypothetical protein